MTVSDAGQAAGDLWQSLSDIAKQRGVSKVAVHKRVKRFVADGALSTKPGPRGTVLVNIVAYDRLVKTETDPSQALRNGLEPAPADEEDAEPAAGNAASPLAPYSASRAEREAYQAENARLDLGERLERLSDREEAGRLAMDAFRRLRDRLLAVPARTAEKLHAAPDAATVRSLLDVELRHELSAFADIAEALEAGEDDKADTIDAGIERAAQAGQRPPPQA